VQNAAESMTEHEAEIIYNDLVRLFGDRLPNYEREPRRFAYCVKIYKHLVKLLGNQHVN
jgi:hypothetical protein